MLSLLFKIFRFLFVVSAVLMLGQVEVQERTIGEHFSGWVKSSFKSTKDKISKSSLVASLPRYLPGANQRIGPKDEDGSDEKSQKKNGEAISSSDRESLLRILQ